MLYDAFNVKFQVKRAKVLGLIRDFFHARHVLEVDTPLMAPAPVTDPYLNALTTACNGLTQYWQTSPEYAMKRLLAAGSGSIYQICKAFRNDELGPWHSPEFTMLEWYRVDFDEHQLMDEVVDLLQLVLGDLSVNRWTYAHGFEQALNINPHRIAIDDLQRLTLKHVNVVGLDHPDRDTCLQLLMSDYIEPRLADKGIVLIYDYPASQAALAQIAKVDGIEVARRFEVYCHGVELANGYFELTDATVQRQRFEADLALRQAKGIEAVPIDEALLAAMEDPGLPSCAGVALGLDRLLKLKK